MKKKFNSKGVIEYDRGIERRRLLFGLKIYIGLVSFGLLICILIAVLPPIWMYSYAKTGDELDEWVAEEQVYKIDIEETFRGELDYKESTNESGYVYSFKDSETLFTSEIDIGKSGDNVIILLVLKASGEVQVVSEQNLMGTMCFGLILSLFALDYLVF